MPRYIAFLRAINVGGRVVTMERLRTLFADMGFTNVQTFIASGNVIFDAKSVATKKLQKDIERQLEASLGYSVATFLRTAEELRAVSLYEPFAADAIAESRAFCIGFLTENLTPESKSALMLLKTDIDDFHVHDREVYWLCHKKQSESTFSNRLFERSTKALTTFRNATTVAKLAAKYGR
ncbi:MAG TPA: DUF1697 domain-containing protein [Bryobacteraceae bacterium]|nr:DUF1697 domain-containing protein [Bryobacteraceae bacterium]